jgi:two-component system, OmpR family, response regulator
MVADAEHRRWLASGVHCSMGTANLEANIDSSVPAGTTLRALVADDDPYLLDLVASILRKEGFLVESASNGTDLVAFLTGGSEPNLMITDVQMPGMSGLAVLSYVKRRHARVPVILMTAFATDRLRERALADGASAVLGKPFTALQLRELVARHVRRE